MKKFILVYMLLCAACISNAVEKTSGSTGEVKTVVVNGLGTTLEEAKYNAFQNAVDFVVGTVVMTTRETKNEKLVKDKILTHSAGYIDSFKIISQKNTQDGIEITIQANVKSSKIAERILGSYGKDESVDGDRMATQYDTYNKDRKTGDELLQSIMYDFNTNGFEVNQTESVWGLLDDRSAVFQVHFEMKYNYKYLVALNEVLKVTSDGKNRNVVQRVVAVQSKDPKAWLFGETNTYYFNDHTRAKMIHEIISGPLSVIVKLYDNKNNVVASACGKDYRGYAFLPNGLYSPNVDITSPVVIRGNETFEGAAQFIFRPNDPNIELLKRSVRIKFKHFRGDC
jgi:hypothetical protein